MIDGRNIWKTDLVKQAELIGQIQNFENHQELFLSASCSMLHIPQDLELETEIEPEILSRLSFAKQKLQELFILKMSVTDPQNFKAHLVENRVGFGW